MVGRARVHLLAFELEKGFRSGKRGRALFKRLLIRLIKTGVKLSTSWQPHPYLLVATWIVGVVLSFWALIEEARTGQPLYVMVTTVGMAFSFTATFLAAHFRRC